MAIVKISALPAATAVVATDLVPIVDDPSGVPATQKATWSLARDYVLGVSGGNATIAETITAPTFIGALQGNADTATSATSATTAGTVTTAAQPAITSVGTLTNATVTNWVRLGAGSAAAPAFSFTADSNSGMYRIGENIIGFAGAGVEQWRYDTTGLTIKALTATAAITGTTAAFSGAVSAPTFTGALVGNADTATSATSATTATNATNIGVTDAGSDTTTWVLLATDQTGTQGARTDTGLTYNASTNTLTATTFVGALTGTALVATNATNIGVTDAGADASTWVLLGTSQTGTQGARTDGGLTYNASTNALTATTFVGALTGNADTATTAGTVTTAAQPSITSVGTLTSLTVSGTVTGGTYNGQTISGTASFTGSVTAVTQMQALYFQAVQSGWTTRLTSNATGSYVDALGAANSFRVLVDSATELTISATEATFAGRIITPASTSGSPGGAGFRLTPGATPIGFANGDMWCDGSGAYIRIGGVTKTFTLT